MTITINCLTSRRLWWKMGVCGGKWGKCRHPWVSRNPGVVSSADIELSWVTMLHMLDMCSSKVTGVESGIQEMECVLCCYEFFQSVLHFTSADTTRT